MKSLRILGLVMLFLGLMSPLVQGQRVADYNAVRDWSSVANPAGAWSCGYKTAWNAPFTLDAAPGSEWTGISAWWPGVIGDMPVIAHNDKKGEICAQTWCLPKNYLMLHPGPNGELSVLRWTVPETGMYVLRVWFEALDWSLITGTNFIVMHDGNGVLLKAHVGAYEQRSVFAPRPMKLGKGETLDFMANWAKSGNNYGGSTGVAVRIWKIR